MSYRIWLEADTGGEPAEVWEAGHTSNTSPMWRKAGAAIHEMDGAPAVECASVLAQAARTIRENAGEYRTMEPPNGWGTVESTATFLQGFADACSQYPKTRVRVWR